MALSYRMWVQPNQWAYAHLHSQNNDQPGHRPTKLLTSLEKLCRADFLKHQQHVFVIDLLQENKDAAVSYYKHKLINTWPWVHNSSITHHLHLIFGVHWFLNPLYSSQFKLFNKCEYFLYLGIYFNLATELMSKVESQIDSAASDAQLTEHCSSIESYQSTTLWKRKKKVNTITFIGEFR